ncbi:hypothetical protein GDO81_027654, partial [Engystomops pustulosus]
MASAGLRKELECSICLSVYTDPVTLRCGHNFCRVCIDQVLNAQDGCRAYSCPECRAVFQVRPALLRNITLRNVAENVRSTQPQQEEVTGICCTYCIHSPHCEASCVMTHLRNQCSVHKKILEYYCTEDAACICVTCSLAGEHRGHQMETLDEASEKKKKKLRNVLQKLTTKRKETVERVHRMEERWRKAQEKVTGEAERVTALFIDLRRRLDDLEKKILSEISRQEMEVSLSMSNVIKELEIEKDELSRKMKDIEEMCNMTDPLTVLQDLCDPEEGGGIKHGGGDVKVRTFGLVGKVISARCESIHGEGPVDLLLDVNTAANNILVSEDLKTATWAFIAPNCPYTPKTFQDYQVVSTRSFSSGRHYWDVEISKSLQWRVGMCYPSIDRRGDQSFIGNNNKSWCLYGGKVYNDQYSVRHDGKEIHFPHQISSNRVRICLDYEAGKLSFYELCDPIRHLHTFTTTFTEPLHAVLY